MSYSPQEPLPDFLRESPNPTKPTAAELQARYHRIKQRQRFLATVGVIFLVLLYVFLRHIAPFLWGGGRRRQR
jgi:hypothetical protein